MPQLKELEDHIYVHEVTCLGASNGELHLSYDGGTVVFNAITLFNDLPTIVRLVMQEQKAETERVLTDLKKNVEYVQE